MTGTHLALVSLMLAGTPCALFLWNLMLYRRAPARESAVSGSQRGVSILIPARNEEHNIRAAVEAALASVDVDLEVVVLDDHSEDGTAAIVQSLADSDARLRLISAPPLPAEWCGKPFACQNLADAATKEMLLFVDADVTLAPDAAVRLAHVLEEGRADLISGVPRQITQTWAEKLLIPLIHFVLLGYLPVWAMRLFRFKGFGAGCGQLFMANADAYRKAGGHAAIRGTRHDGLKLPKAFRVAGFFTDLVDATDLAACRLYHNAREVWDGLLKNATEGLGAPGVIVPMTVFLIGGQVLPFALLIYALSPFGGIGRDATVYIAAAAACALLPRFLSVVRFRQPFFAALFHPFGVIVLEWIQWTALLNKIIGRKSSWKGREEAGTVKVP